MIDPIQRRLIKIINQKEMNSTLMLLISASIGISITFGAVKVTEQFADTSLTQKQTYLLSTFGGVATSGFTLLILRFLNIDYNIYLKRKEGIREKARELLERSGLSAMNEALILLIDADIIPFKESGIPTNDESYKILESFTSNLYQVIKEIIPIIKYDLISIIERELPDDIDEYDRSIYYINSLHKFLDELSCIYENDKVYHYNFFEFLPGYRNERIKRVVDKWRQKYISILRQVELDLVDIQGNSPTKALPEISSLQEIPEPPRTRQKKN